MDAQPDDDTVVRQPRFTGSRGDALLALSVDPAVLDGYDVNADTVILERSPAALTAATAAVPTRSDPATAPLSAGPASAGRVSAGRVPAGPVVIGPLRADLLPTAPLDYSFSVNEDRPIPLDAPAFIGRRPSLPRIVKGRSPRLVRVPSPLREVSGTHLELRQQGALVIVTDLRSTNGTVVTVPGRAPVKLRGGESIVVSPGTVVDIGDDNLIEILPLGPQQQGETVMTELGHKTAERSIALPGPVGGDLVIAWGASTDVGLRRAHNEDSLIAESPMFAIADGMGGHAAGDVASAAVVARLAEAVETDFTGRGAIERALLAATADISHATDEQSLGVGTTVTGAALIIQDGNPFWMVFNVGDSRVYAFEQNELLQITTDHSVVQELVAAGLIRREDAEAHPDSNVITRAVGFNADPRTDFWAVPARSGLRLLLCSDGLTREVDDEHIRLQLAAGLPPFATAEALVQAALESGGRDNVSTIVVDVVERSGPLDLEDTAPRARVPHSPKKG